MPTFTGDNNDNTIDIGLTAVDPTVVNTIYGLGNDDTIIGGGGFGPTFLIDDLIFGGNGSDSITSNYGDDTIYGGAGDDILDNRNLLATGETVAGGGFRPSVQTFYGGAGNDSIFGYEGDDTIFGGDGDDTISSNFARLSPTPGGDVVYGDAGDDVITTLGSDGTTQSSVGDTVYGGTGNDSILGAIESSNDNQDNDFLFGGDGNDTIDGNGGTDSINGGGGDDLVLASSGEDSTDGGAGIDTIDFTNDEGAVVFNMETGATTIAGVAPVTESNINYENAVGTNLADTIYGSTADNSIGGGAGVDTLYGGEGNDTLNSGAGDDILIGGEDVGDGDIDTVDYSNETNGVTVRYTGDEAGTAQGTSTGVDTFSEIERIVFSAADDAVVATNDTVGVTLNTGAGDDFVEAGSGNDSLDGGDDIDTLSYADATGPITVDIGAGTASGTGTGSDTFQNFENFTLTDQGDTATGSTGNDTISSGAGEDIIYSGGGNDNLQTGADNDTIFAVTDGDDVITVNGGGTGSGPVPGDTDILNLTTAVPPGGTFQVLYSGGDDEDGVVEIYSGAVDPANLIGTVNFTEIEEIVCFTRGTMIETPDGEIAIEDLGEGDLVLTRDHGAQPIRWIGSRKMAGIGKVAPVVIKAGALDNDRDLRVSPLHRMLISDWRAELMFGESEVLATAKHLVNGDTIYVEEGLEVEYFHMLFDQHEIVTANGAPSESFHPGEQGMGWLDEEIREEIFTIFPELRGDYAEYGPSARTSLKAFEARALKR